MDCRFRHVCPYPANPTNSRFRLSPLQETVMLRRLYDRTIDLAAHRHAIWVLAAVAFTESFVFPVPPDVLLIPMVLAARRRAWRIALVCTAASVAGGLLGYGIGAVLYEGIGRQIVEFYGYGPQFANASGLYNEYGAWIVLVAGLTPIPYKIFTIASGVAALDPAVFVAASVVARGLRFFLIAALLYWIGPPVRDFVERRLGLVFALFCILLVGGFVIVGALA